MKGLTVLIAVAACHHPRAPREAFQAEAFLVPRDAVPRELAVCSTGEAYVPRGGGVVIAGSHEWFIAPGGVPVTSVACDDGNNLFVIRGHELVTRGPDDSARIPLPDGDWHVVGAPRANVWLFGRLADGRGAILHYDPTHALGTVYVGDKPIRALAALDTDGVIAVLDRDLVVWHGESAVDLGMIGPNVDGLAVAGDGTLFISGPAGIVRWRSGAGSYEPEKIVAHLHGALRAYAGWLYVFSQDTSTVMRLTPRTEEVTTTTTEVHGSIFSDGPASDRRSSMDGGFAYVSMTQGAAGLHGVSGELDLGPSFSRHLYLGVQMRVAFGSPPSSPLSYVDFGVRAPVGVRIPFGWFSLSGGAGIELRTLTEDNSAQPGSVGVQTQDLFVPLWARFEVELGCIVGLYGEASDSVGLTGAPAYTTIGAGIVFRGLRTCY